MTTYTAISIGPIYKTILKARSTRSFWVASYLFSWIAGKLIQEIRQEKFPVKILSPYLPENLFKMPTNVGLMPDRIFIEGNIADWDGLKAKVMDSLSDEVMKSLNSKSSTTDKDTVKNELENYLRIICIELDLDQGINPLVELNSYLDVQELSGKAYCPVETDLVGDFISSKDNSLLTGSFGLDRPFQSISEIAISNLFNEQFDQVKKDEAGEVVYSELEREDKFLNCSKYLAIVKADGDNFGRKIADLGSDPSKIEAFSRRVYEYSVKAVAILDRFGAVPVYAGGDDLLFFAPLAYEKSQDSLLKLIEAIDECFAETFHENDEDPSSKALSMSYGISIFYHKSPLAEAMMRADEMLQRAKGTKDKNCIAITVQKHSGQSFEILVPKANLQLRKCIDRVIMPDKRVEFEQIEGFKYWLRDMYLPLIRYVAGSEERLNATMANFFNEDIHRQSKKQRFFLAVSDLIHQIHLNEANVAENSEEANDRRDEKNRDCIYGLLKYSQFISAKTEKEA